MDIYVISSIDHRYRQIDIQDQEEQTTKPFNTNNKRKKRWAKKKTDRFSEERLHTYTHTL